MENIELSQYELATLLAALGEYSNSVRTDVNIVPSVRALMIVDFNKLEDKLRATAVKGLRK